MSVFNFNSTVGTFLHEAYAFGIVENPSIPSPLLNSHIQLAFPLRAHFNDKLHLDFYPALSLPGYAAIGALKMRNYATKLPQIISIGELPGTVLSILKKQEYALMYADYFYIEGTANYAKDHFRHDLLIFDYIPSSRKFRGAAYTNNGQFGLVTVSAKRLAEAFTSPSARGKECDFYCRGDLLAAFKAKSHRGRLSKLDLADIRTQLKCYMEGADLARHPLNNATINRICQMYGQRHSNVAFGIRVYDEIPKYFDRAFSKGDLWNGLRITRLLWEHKKLMKVRLVRMVEEGMALDPDFLSEWDEIEKRAYLIHLKAMAAQRKIELYSSSDLSAGLNKIKALESGFIERLLGKL